MKFSANMYILKIKKYQLILIGMSLLFTLSSCSSTKNISAPASLYKSDEAKQIAYASYDKAMGLWDVAYTEDYVETDYGSTHIIVSGNANAEPLFVLPGLFGDATMWYANAGELSKHYRVYTLDMANYGGKSIPSGKAVNELNDYVVWFSQIMNHYNVETAPLLGLSYSSWLCLALAREMPEKISSIILLDPSETFMPMNGGIAWKGFKYFMFFPNRKKYVKFMDWIGGGYNDPKCAIWNEHMLDVIEYGSVKMFDVPQHHIYQPEELKMIKMPVLVMAGGKPILYDSPKKFKNKVESAIPHAEVVIVPETGHGMNMEKPEEVNNKIIEFLGTK